MQKTIWIFTALVLAGGVAFGDTSRYTATLAQPLAEKKDFMISGNLFRCDGSVCVLVSIPSDAGSIQICRALQRRVGALTAYGVEGRTFDSEKLAKCNAA